MKMVEYLADYSILPYFHDMVDYFVARGYQRDVSIRAAPYDWRFAAGINDRNSYLCTHAHVYQHAPPLVCIG